MTEQPAIDRIPIGISVNFAVRNAPDVPNKYGSGSLTPTEITLTYRSTKDSQLGRVHAYVKGRWRRDAVLEATDMPLPGQHYTGDMATWPAWLAEEARLHDPAAVPAVPVPPTTHATDRAALVEVAAQAIRDSNGTPEALAWWKAHPQLIPAHVYADAVLAVLPPPVSRTDVLREAEHTPATEARTPCSVPNPCEDGELCATREKEQAHAEGEHAFCGPECEGVPTGRHYEVHDETRPCCSCGRFWPCELATPPADEEQPETRQNEGQA